MVDKATLEVAIKYFFLMLNKYTDAFVLEFSYHTGTQVYHLLIVIINTFVVYTL